MSEYRYVAQAVLIAGVAMTLVWRRHPIMKAQIALWCLGVSAIAVRYGLVAQLDFYSNDQEQYAKVVARLVVQDWSPDLDSWLTGWRIPFTMPAVPLGMVGIDPALALKTVSLGYLLLVTHCICTELESSQIPTTLRNLYLTSCLGIGVFFSTFALRETAMMYFVLKFFTGTSPVTRLLAMFFLYQLRPHLAASAVVGMLLTQLVRRLWSGSRSSVIRNVVEILLAIVVGQVLYSFGLSRAIGSVAIVTRAWSINDTLRIASNFVGLQFLTANEDTVTYSIRSLLSSRLILSETIVIPLVFSIAVFLKSHLLTVASRGVLMSFAIYVSIATNTDFNSFRQNIPFIPLMGLIILGTRAFRVQSLDTAKRHIPAH